ncbi:DUF3157 family protein [Shewanella sp. 202IG2-18]|uniref:DUF3157 family protein n=1 Tax=Parashewanella hymeniacidonis TaxID=2807618 RepID=UPI001961FC16|nr:DUF3157 family protein [Parashewanella hymeniacidonis]MBM7073203.1 DUF3157 family protein [Parashewanella hymeniacidonis]
MKKLMLGVISVLLCCNAFAADTVIQLKDGRSVVLHDDFTWSYVQPQAQSQQSRVKEQSTKTKPQQAIPVVSLPQQRFAQVQLGSDKNILQLEQSGVGLLFHAARYEQGALVIPVSVTNSGKSSVIKVDITYTLFDSQRQQIVKDETSVWTSVKRLPETYLRSGKQAKGIALKIPVGKLSSYELKAEISDISTRN